MSEEVLSIGELLKRRMSELDLKSKDVSEGSGVSKHMVSKAINGHLVKVDSGSMLKICNFLGVDVRRAKSLEFKKVPKELQPENCTIIMNAVKDVWDGTHESASAIAKLLHTAHWMSRIGHNNVNLP